MFWPRPSMWKSSSARPMPSIAAVAGRGPGAELGDHRVVEHRDLVALAHAGVVADRIAAVASPSCGGSVADQPADRGQEAAVGVLGVDAALHRPAVDLQVLLGERQLLAGGRADHLLDQVDAGDQLGDRVLDLQAGVHLQEVEALVLAGDELDRAGAVVVRPPWPGRRPGRPWRRGSPRRAAGEGASSMTFWLRRWIEHSRSNRWTTLPCLSPSTWISMWRGLVDELLDEDAVVAEGGLGLGAHGGEALLDVRAGSRRRGCPCRRRRPRP